MSVMMLGVGWGRQQKNLETQSEVQGNSKREQYSQQTVSNNWNWTSAQSHMVKMNQRTHLYCTENLTTG